MQNWFRWIRKDRITYVLNNLRLILAAIKPDLIQKDTNRVNFDQEVKSYIERTLIIH